MTPDLKALLEEVAPALLDGALALEAHPHSTLYKQLANRSRRLAAQVEAAASGAGEPVHCEGCDGGPWHGKACPGIAASPEPGEAKTASNMAPGQWDYKDCPNGDAPCPKHQQAGKWCHARATLDAARSIRSGRSGGGA